MKTLLVIILSFLTVTINATEITVLKCSDNQMASDGQNNELTITKKENGTFTYQLVTESYSMTSGPKSLVSIVEISSCRFSKKQSGVGECYERTADGYAGKNLLSLSHIYSPNLSGSYRDILKATNYKIDENNKSSISHEILVDLTKCKFSI